MLEVRRAITTDIDELAPLFDAYRQFYEQSPDLVLARSFLKERLERDQSVIFLARDKNKRVIGFTQLYPTFCSVEARNVWVLYDLFVDPASRRHGAARRLMNAAQAFGADTGAAWLKLETAVTNIPGQALYENQNWRRDDAFLTYYFDLGD